MFVAALFQYTYLGVTFGVFQNLLHPRMRATGSALLNTVYGLIGQGLGPLLVGWLSDRLAPDTAAATASPMRWRSPRRSTSGRRRITCSRAGTCAATSPRFATSAVPLPLDMPDMTAISVITEIGAESWRH